MSRRGFTLIELLVVISIIALIASIVIASLNTARERGRIGSGRQFEANVYHAAADSAAGIWDFDECTSSTTADRSGNGNTGTLTSGPVWSVDTPTGTGCSLTFNGSNSYVDMGNGSSVNFDTGDFSFSFWVKTSDNSNYKGMISKGAAVAAVAGFKSTTIISSDKIRVDVANGTSYVISGLQSSVPVADGRWHHVVFVGDRSDYGTLYVDGLFNSRQAFTDSGAPTSISGSTTFRAGSETASRFLLGNVDGVRLYGKTLTAGEIGELYAEGLKKIYATK